jgi:hypothetical protein
MATMRSKSWWALPLALCLCACAVTVSDSGLTNQVRSRVFYIEKSSPRTLYSVRDEGVTYWATLDPSLLADYVRFRIDWIDPQGKVFASRKTTLMWKTHNNIVATLPIRNNYPSRMPGDWKVRLYRGDSILDEARFTIEQPKRGSRGGGS